ncbi:MAG TPA: hypothetical protein HA222_01510 [Candidatus Diapherotrites archaeon]|uniref:Uncharacterized protein n=1 Tax=Candidatus Iainarchaeum sp. TaxID=3101447 RepID=A0A7J4JU57_9ARCH|nr:hypothetical protein [Candidatus Diapherotrites archaeon]
MISSYNFLNRLYFSMLVAGLLLLAASAAAFLSLPSGIAFAILAASFILILAGILCKILVWYNVYSEVVTKEEFKKATAHGSVFSQKKKSRE